MSFITPAVAGPSRIPYGAKVVSTVVCARRAYAEQAQRRRGEDEPESHIVGGVGVPEQSAPSRDAPKSYEEWVYKVGWKYRRPQPGQKARWLGNEVPYASNPSFRPPPPLSDAFMTTLANELRDGKRTIGQISQAHNVSKHRLDAIRKLKEVEAEFVRQKLPLQHAFQQNMEVLLGCDRTPTKASVAQQREAELARVSHPSTAVELQEEHDAVHTPGVGAFGKTMTEQGLEKDVWEMQDEKTYLANEKAEAEARAERKAAELEQIARGTDADSLGRKSTGPAFPQQTATAGKTVFRFVDMSGKKPKAQKQKK